MAAYDIGAVYRFTHKRKGTFEAKVLGVEPTKNGDPQDTELVRVLIDTTEGGPYTWMAHAVYYDEQGRKHPSPATEKLLRPSLITKAEKV